MFLKFFRGHGFHPCRTVVRIGDRQALTFDLLDVDVIFLFNLLAQAVDGHLLLGKIHVNAAPFLLQLIQTITFTTKGIVPVFNRLVLLFALTNQHIDLLAENVPLVLNALDLPLGCLDPFFRICFASQKTTQLFFAPGDQRRQFLDPFFQRTLLAFE